MRDVELIELAVELVNRGGLFLLDSPVGAMELHGDDFRLSGSNSWLAVYHDSEPGGEARSHLHLKTGVLKAARIVEEDGATPYLGFWENLDCAGEAALRVYFPSWYDWARDKALIDANVAYCARWIEAHGREFRFD